MTERFMPPPSNAGDRQLLASLIENVFFAEPLFDALPDVVFFVKDADGRYVLVNRTLVSRCGLCGKSALVGRTAAQAFPGGFGPAYLAQDQAVLGGAEIHDQLELHLYPDREPGWCLTCKIPLRGAGGTIVGLAGISRDLAMPDKKHPVYRRIAAAARHIQEHPAPPPSLAVLAGIARLSGAQLERHFQRIFHLTPRQMIVKTRLDAAARLLAGTQSITAIALACGYQDHSAFTRQFKATVGVTPSAYRALLKQDAGSLDESRTVGR